MPPTAKKNRKEATDKKDSSPKNKKSKPSVVSGQLQKSIENKEKAKKKKFRKPTRGVVFIKNIPKEFLEEQIRKYFKQFGQVTRIRVARSRKTGGSRGFAYVEFDLPEVAEIAAETMNNYLMFRKIVKATYIPPEKQEYDYFRSGIKKVVNKMGKTTFVSHKIRAANRKVKHLNDWSEKNCEKRLKRTEAKLRKLKVQWAKYGFDLDDYVYRPDGYVTKEPGAVPAKKRKISESEKSSEKVEEDQKIPLKRLLEDTIEDSSDDEDFLPINEKLSDDESDDDGEEAESAESEDSDSDEDDDDDDDEEFLEEESDSDSDESLDETTSATLSPSPKKPAKKSHKQSQPPAIKVLKPSPLAGKIHKKEKPVKSKRSPALQQAIKATAKTMMAEKTVTKQKAKDLKRGNKRKGKA